VPHPAARVSPAGCLTPTRDEPLVAFAHTAVPFVRPLDGLVTPGAPLLGISCSHAPRAASEGACRFHFLVPATGPRAQASTSCAGPQRGKLLEQATLVGTYERERLLRDSAEITAAGR
jgi:hypothetical protein